MGVFPFSTLRHSRQASTLTSLIRSRRICQRDAGLSARTPQYLWSHSAPWLGQGPLPTTSPGLASLVASTLAMDRETGTCPSSFDVASTCNFKHHAKADHGFDV